MKLEEVKNNRFEPFTIKITIENEEELKELWCRLNTNINKVKEANNHLIGSDIKYTEFDYPSYIALFELIDSKLHS